MGWDALSYDVNCRRLGRKDKDGVGGGVKGAGRGVDFCMTLLYDLPEWL